MYDQLQGQLKKADLKDKAVQEMIKLSGIETRTPQNLASRQTRKQELLHILADQKSEMLKDFFHFLFGKTTIAKKADLAELFAEILTFPDEEQFREFFFAFPVIVQILLYEGAFTDFVLPEPLEKKLKVPLVIKNKNSYSWRNDWHLNPDLHLNFAYFDVYYGHPNIAIPFFLRKVLSQWLVPPACWELSACKAEDQDKFWTSTHVILDSYPLLCDALWGMTEGNNPDHEKNLRTGFKKGVLNELRASTGFLPFSLGTEYAPDSVDLAARFILCISGNKPSRPKDEQDGIRNMVAIFFRETGSSNRWYAPDRAYLEFTICLDHLSRTPGYYLDDDADALPVSRKVFRDMLLYAARDGGWFDADLLAENIRVTGRDFSFCSVYLEHSLRIKADTITVDGLTYTPGYDDFHPSGVMRYYLLVRPLFKAYCYIFAALGLLDIVQAVPPMERSFREKKRPLSVYDSLKAIRVTELGRWCLGLTAERPPRPSREYHAIADRELLLVTIQGSSLERQVFLDKIGQRLGENRWRISPASFITGCTSKKMITDRIQRFRTLIDEKPAPHWEQLFTKVINRAGLFSESRKDMLVYDLPESREILEELLRDSEFKNIVLRAEGRKVLVAYKDQKKFYAILNDHGIAQFE